MSWHAHQVVLEVGDQLGSVLKAVLGEEDVPTGGRSDGRVDKVDQLGERSHVGGHLG